MNERIKQLAIEAGFYANPDVEKFEKFAELIVRECAELMKKESEEYYDVGDDYCDHKANAFDEAVNLVKKHFGVEL
jgi:hypothetical protein